MTRYAVLVRESANRVYRRAAPRLAAAEIAALAPTLSCDVRDIEVESIAGVDYVSFSALSLDDDDVVVLSCASGTRATFEQLGGGDLRPVDRRPVEFFDDDLVTMQRYPGKTNEQFTHLLVNLAVAASASAAERSRHGRPVRVLDPVAGRGSTLNRALVHGFDATGIEVVEADVDQYRTFVTGYLQEHRIKHRVRRERVRKGPLAGTWRFSVTIRGGQELLVVRGATESAADLLPGRTFDAVVGDLPYGVQHRAAGGSRRSPGELVDAAIEGWTALSRRGSSLTLSFNARTLPRRDLESTLRTAGWTPVDHPLPFEHAVDRTITRDVVVAIR